MRGGEAKGVFMSNVDTLKLLGSLLGSGAASQGTGASILQSVLGSAMGGQSQSSGGLGGVLGAVLGGSQPQQAQQSSGLGSVLGAVLGGSQPQQAQQPQAAAGLAGLAGLLGGGGSSGLGGLLGAAMGQYGDAQAGQATQATQCNHLPQGVSQSEASSQAEVLLKAMINAAKSDGRFDAKEEQAILGKLGNVTQEEVDYIRTELAKPLDVQAFARTIPRGLEQQAYSMSLMAIDLDSQAEAQYLDQLAKAIGISQEMSNQIHQQMGVPVLYS